jgi:hypothetical protein
MAKNVDQEYRQLYKQYMNAGVDPATVGGWGQQAAAAQATYKDTQALLTHERKSLGRQTRQQVRDIRTQGRWDMQASAAAANERGVLGGSSDVQARQQIRSSTASGVIAARQALDEGVNNLISQGIQARRDYFSQLANIAMQRAAAKATAGTQAFAQATMDSLVNGNAGNGQVNYNNNSELNMRQAVNRSDNFRELLHNLTRAGFRVGETGVPGYGGVTPGIHENPGPHYQNPRRTADINIGPGGASDYERRKLTKLYRLLTAAGIPVGNIYYPGNDPKGHDDHLHLEVLMKRWGKKAQKNNNKGKKAEGE